MGATDLCSFSLLVKEWEALSPFLVVVLDPWTQAGLFCPCRWCVFREQLSYCRLCLCLQGSLIGRPAGVKMASS